MEKLNLETSYDLNGNSTGTAIDTLAIAIDGRDYNELEEYNYEWMWEAEDSAKKYWIDNDAEAFFQKSLTKKQAKQYADDLVAYEAALTEYKDTNFEEVRAGDWPEDCDAQKACADAMEKDLSDAQTQLWNDWLNGDYRGNFAGLLPQAKKEWGIEFEEEKGDVLADITPEFIQELKNDGEIERKSKKAAREWLENCIDGMARTKYSTKKREQEARRAENEKTREYKKNRAEAQKEAKRQELLALTK